MKIDCSGDSSWKVASFVSEMSPLQPSSETEATRKKPLEGSASQDLVRIRIGDKIRVLRPSPPPPYPPYLSELPRQTTIPRRSRGSIAWEERQSRFVSVASSALAFLSLALRRFLRSTSLHGLKYLAPSSPARGRSRRSRRHPAERAFWVAAVATSWFLCGFFVFKVLEKWNESPVLITFSNVQSGIYDIPFPSVTVCNMNKVRRSRVLRIERELNRTGSKEAAREMRFVREVCAKHENLNEENGETFGDDLGQSESLDGSKVREYLADLGNPCEEMLLRCHFEGRYFNCSQLFTPTITDEGQCCSFNTMPESVMYTELLASPNTEEESRWNGWTLEGGFKSYQTLNELHSTKKMPLRALAPGLHMGLSVILDAKAEDYYCTGHESVGFKLFLHTPVTMPEMIEYGFALSPGTEVFNSVSPKVIMADKSIHSLPMEKRGCYLSGERKLTYFKHYTFLNCFMECASNFSYLHCGCVAYYMPRDPRTMPICSFEKSHCVDEAVTLAEESSSGNASRSFGLGACSCEPPCTDMEFPHETSFGKLSQADLLSLPEDLKGRNPEYKNDTYVKNNLAIVHIFFEHLHFMSHQRSEIYGTVDFFSNIGGLMSLCCGFSALSLVEFGYFFSLRLYINLTRNLDGETKNTG